jgi:hypothetical protein
LVKFAYFDEDGKKVIKLTQDPNGLSEASGRPVVQPNSHIGLKRFSEMHAMGRKSCEIFSSKRTYVEHDCVWIIDIQLVLSQHTDLKSDLLDNHNSL